jgi:hypothetical protein
LRYCTRVYDTLPGCFCRGSFGCDDVTHIPFSIAQEGVERFKVIGFVLVVEQINILGNKFVMQRLLIGIEYQEDVDGVAGLIDGKGDQESGTASWACSGRFYSGRLKS